MAGEEDLTAEQTEKLLQFQVILAGIVEKNVTELEYNSCRRQSNVKIIPDLGNFAVNLH